MDKKKIIILVVALVVVIVGVLIVGLMKKGKEEDKVEAVITLDINPSMELEITRKGKVARINSLNEDSDGFIDHTLEGKPVEEVFYAIVKRAKDENLVENGELTIIVGMEKGNKNVEDKLREACNKNEIGSKIVVPKITEEARKEAKAYGVTPAKAAYILDVIGDNEELHFDDLMTKSSRELVEMKETGKYCDHDYVLRGDVCERAIREEKPEEGKTCPEGYEDVNGQCRKIGPFKDELYCEEGFTLSDGKCSGEVAEAAKATCTQGTYNSASGKCEESTKVGEATKKCPSSEQKLLDNGRCASPHMGAHFDDPEGTIDPATECCCGDTWVADSSAPGRGWCYSLPNGNDDAIATCSTGTYKDGACYSVTSTDATYSCSNGTLKGNKCMVNKETKALTKHGCEKGYTLHQDRVCISDTETKDYIVGLTCTNEARLENEHCVYYEQVEAKTR